MAGCLLVVNRIILGVVCGKIRDFMLSGEQFLYIAVELRPTMGRLPHTTVSLVLLGEGAAGTVRFSPMFGLSTELVTKGNLAVLKEI